MTKRQAHRLTTRAQPPILFYSTQAFGGWNGRSLVPHLRILDTQGAPIWWLTNLAGIQTRQQAELDYAGITVAKTLNLAQPVWARITAYKQHHPRAYQDWWQVYRALDPRPLKACAGLFVMGGLLSQGSHLGRYQNRAGVFPHDAGQLRFASQSKHLINILMLLKAHHEYGIPLHEWAFDPLEMSLDLFHADVAPRQHYYLYHGYPIPSYQTRRLDSLQYFYESTPISHDTQKTLDFVFGYTMLKGSGREGYDAYIKDLLNRFPRQRRKLFVRDDNKKIDTLVSKPVYLDHLARANYTLILPAYDAKQFSIFRLLEALRLDCCPIIHPDVKTRSLEKSFGVDLSLMRTVPRSEPARRERLDYLKSKFLKFRKSFVR